MDYKYGVNLLLWTENFSKEDLPLLSEIKQLGLDAVEIPIFIPDNFPSTIVGEELEKQKLDACVCYGCNVNSDIASLDEDTRQYGINEFKRVIDNAREIGAKKIGGVVYKASGMFTGFAPTKEEWDTSVNSMKKIAQYAQKFDISIGVEPVNRYETYFMNTAEEAVRYCKDVGEPNMFVLLDTHHIILEESSFIEPIIETGDYLGHFHTSENHRGIPGTGLVNWKEVFQALKDINYSGWLVIESFHPGFGNVWKSLVDSPANFLRKSLDFLKGIEQEVFG
jgi:D-psicose/D-tagatose/L-ribulose 3-epimerase